MTNDLQERLRTLAERAPAPRSGADLWRAGRRRQVRRAVATGVAAVLLASSVGLGAAAAWDRLSKPEPVGATSQPRLPARFFVPSPWLAGTDDDGPIGPLSAVTESERREWFDSGNELAGISAATGEYRFLHLPDRAGFGDSSGSSLPPALSPDGRRLAYWYQGSPDGEPIGTVSGQQAIVGVAVYDTLDGTLERLAIPTDHGLSPQGLAWGGKTLFMKANQYQPGVFGDDGYARSEGVWHWQAGGKPVLVESSYRFLIDGGAPDGYVADDGRGSVVVHADGTHVRISGRRSFTGTPVLSPDGRLAVGVDDPTPNSDDGKPQPLAVVDVGSTERRDIPDAVAWQVLGWRDASHVVVANPDELGQNLVITAVDIDTGRGTPLTVRPWNDGLPFVVASDVWSAPLGTADEPDWPMDPRLRAVLWTLAIGALLVGFRILRRRRAGP